MKAIIILAGLLQMCSLVYSQNVGIGIANPVFKLDVRNGSINVDSVYRIDSLTVLAASEDNLFVGVNAGKVNTGYGNTYTGAYAGYNTAFGTFNSFFGLASGQNNIGSYNSFFGSFAGYANTSIYNSFFGISAGSSNTGPYNSFFGSNAGGLNESGYDNSFFGMDAGSSNVTGNANSFFGKNAGYINDEGYENCFFGKNAGFSNYGGDYNCFFGESSGYSNNGGYDNSFFGESSGLTNTSGTRNTAIGYAADVMSGALTNATAIGHNAKVDASDKVRIGDGFIGSIGGNVGWTTFSDGRFKRQIRDDVPGLTFIQKLHAVTYLVDTEGLNNYYSEGSQDPKSFDKRSLPGIRQSGFIAQDVETAADELGFTFTGVDKPQSENGLYGLRYAAFVVPLVKAVQEQQTIIELQNEKIDQLEMQIDDLRKLVIEVVSKK